MCHAKKKEKEQSPSIRNGRGKFFLKDTATYAAVGHLHGRLKKPTPELRLLSASTFAYVWRRNKIPP